MFLFSRSEMRVNNMVSKPPETEQHFVGAKFLVQRNGYTDRVTVELGDELDVSEADSIEIIEFAVGVRE